MAHTISFSSYSDIGASRAENEDSFGIFPQDPFELPGPQGQLFVVADGMGGHLGGREASATAVRSVAQHYLADQTGRTARALQHALEAANAEIYAHAQTSVRLYGMGSTCTALVVKENKAWVAHVGDSRVYRITAKNIWQLTHDHAKAAEMERHGILTKKEAQYHPERSVLTRALGLAPEAEIDMIEDIPANPGEYFLLCTDGLAKVEEKTLQKVVLAHSPDAACRNLVELAIAQGGQDNITVQVIRIDSASVSTSDSSRSHPKKSIAWLAAFVATWVLALLVYKFQGRPHVVAESPTAAVVSPPASQELASAESLAVPVMDSLSKHARLSALPLDSAVAARSNDSSLVHELRLASAAAAIPPLAEAEAQQDQAKPATIFGLPLSQWRWPGLRVKKDYQVQDDKLLFFATAKNKLALQGTDVADVDLEVRAKVFSAAPGGRLGIILGYAPGKTRSSQTFFLIAMNAAGETSLQKIANGAEEVLFRKATSFNSADTLHLSVKNLGPWILAYVDGKLVGNWEGEDFIKGSAGLYADTEVQVEFLELKMTKAVGLEVEK